MDEFPEDDPEYPGVRWVLAQYILFYFEDGKAMPRCQDLPAKAFGTIKDATRVFAVTHPWLGRWHPDPAGIQTETMRAKLTKMKKQIMLDPTDVVFYDYLCLPQCDVNGVDDRSAKEKERFRLALSGDLMGRIYLTCRVIFIDEVPTNAESNTQYLARGWCYFESVVASMNTFPRDLAWTEKSLKDEIARFREMSKDFRETGDIDRLLSSFDNELATKLFANPDDKTLVRSFFISLATSQRLIAAAARGDAEGTERALDDGADPGARNGQGYTALQIAANNGRTGVVAILLKRISAAVAAMLTMEKETTLQLAHNWRECQVLLRHYSGDAFPLLMVRSIECDLPAVEELLSPSQLAEAKGSFISRSSVTEENVVGNADMLVATPNDSTIVPSKPTMLSTSTVAKAGPKSMAAVAKAKGSSSKAKSMPKRGTAMKSAANLMLQPKNSSSLALAMPTEEKNMDGSNEKVVELLKEKIAAVTSSKGSLLGRVDINECDDTGSTALHYAVSLNHVSIVKALVSAKADSGSLLNKDGESALELARRLDLKEVLSILSP